MTKAKEDSIKYKQAEASATKSVAAKESATAPTAVAVRPGRRSAKHSDESGERLNPLVELTFARVREFVREPEAVFWVFIFPVLLAFVLGIAFRNTAPEENRIVIEGSLSDSATVELAAKLSASEDIEAVVMSPEEAALALRTGRVSLVVSANKAQAEQNSQDSSSAERLAANAESQAPAPGFEYRYDPTRPESRMARLAVDDALQRAHGRSDVAAVREETKTEPGARYIDWLIPGIIGLNLMGSGMWGLGFAVVYARNRKLLKRFAATPMRRSHYLLSFMLSRLIFLVGEVAAVIIFGWFAFNVAVHGSLLDVAIISLIGAMTFGGLGLLVAARPRTIEGVSGLMNLVMVPMWLFSGVFFSSSRFPDALQPFIQSLPLTALNDSLRAVMSEGATLASLWPEAAVLLAWALISFALAMKVFRWQ